MASKTKLCTYCQKIRFPKGQNLQHCEQCTEYLANLSRSWLDFDPKAFPVGVWCSSKIISIKEWLQTIHRK